MRRAAPALLALAVAGCGVATAPFEVPGPRDIAGLERRFAEDPSDPGIGMALAAAVASTDHGMALRVLEQATAAAPRDPTLTLTSGLAHQAGGDPVAAAGAYERYLRINPRSPLRTEVAQRRVSLQHAVDRAVAASLVTASSGGVQGASFGRIAVLPFEVRTAPGAVAPDLSALSHAVADLLADRLREVDLQVAPVSLAAAVLDEIDLPPGSLPSGIAVRSALGVEALVEGSLQVESDGRWVVDLRVVTLTAGVPTVWGAPTAESPAHDPVAALARSAVLLTEGLESAVTPRQAAILTTRATSDPHAIAAYGAGLVATMAGDHMTARDAFGDALALDPSFARAARAEAQALAGAELAGRDFLSELVRVARLGERERVATAASGDAIGSGASGSLAPSDRGAFAEILGLDRLATAGLLEFEILLPGSGP